MKKLIIIVTCLFIVLCCERGYYEKEKIISIKDNKNKEEKYTRFEVNYDSDIYPYGDGSSWYRKIYILKDKESGDEYILIISRNNNIKDTFKMIKKGDKER